MELSSNFLLYGSQDITGTNNFEPVYNTGDLTFSGSYETA